MLKYTCNIARKLNVFIFQFHDASHLANPEGGVYYSIIALFHIIDYQTIY